MQTQRRRLAVSLLGLISLAVMPAATDADAHSGGFGHGSGHVFAFTHGPQGASPQGAALQAAVPAGGTHIVVMSPGQPFPNASMFRHQHTIGSHFATLGYGGAWLNTYLYAPTILLEQRQAANNALVRRRGPSIKTPDPARRGIVLVRGTSKSYVLFP